VTKIAALTTTLAEIVHEGGAVAPQRICVACVEALPVDGAAITAMTSANHQEPIFATDQVAFRLDELQFTLGEGPCVEAFTDRRPVLVSDLEDLNDSRWPMFAAAARGTPARALYVFPLQAGVIGIGVLDLYRDSPGLLEGRELAGALRVADAALWTLLGLRSGETLGSADEPRAGDRHGWLTGTPLHRRVIYQATGMIIAQLEVNAEGALARIRAHAFRHERELADVARDVVERRLRFEQEEKL
jgi:hypothetical protein